MFKSKKLAIKYLLYIVTLVLIVAICAGCGEAGVVPMQYKSIATAALDSQSIAINNDYELLWDNESNSLMFKSKDNGNYLSNILFESFKNGNITTNSCSPISITVVNNKTLKFDTISCYSEIIEAGNGSLSCKKIENGLRTTYFFDKYKIAVPVDYTISNESLDISIDSNNILEDGETYSLVSVAVAPYLCSVKNDATNGAVFVPTGCGALMYSKENAEGVRKYTGEVYGSDLSRQTPTDFNDEEKITMPVFGTYGDSKGSFAIIKSGAESCEISAQTGNDSLGYSGVGLTYYVRGYDEFFYVFYGKDQGLTKRASKNISGTKLKVSYYLLSGESASIAGMAKLYRDYLLKTDKLKRSNCEGKSYSLTILGGTSVTKSILGVPKKEIKALTTFNEAEKIVKEMNKLTGCSPTVRMLGYGDLGLNPGTVGGGNKYLSVYGNKSDIKRLVKVLKDKNLYFDSNIIEFSKSGDGFSKSSDVAKTAINYKSEHFPVSPSRNLDEDNPYYILSRNSINKAIETVVKKASKYDYKGISLSSLGSSAYSDFSYDRYMVKNNIATDVKKYLSKIKDNDLDVAVAHPNDYSTYSSDVSFDVSCSNGDYSVFDVEVPFYQMVFHSYKPMYSNAVNLEENICQSVAKDIAYGIGLGFSVSDNYIAESDDFAFYKLYGTLYKNTKSLIVDNVIKNGYLKLFEKIKNSQFINYSIENGVSISEYSDGTVVYVNHNNYEISTSVGKLRPYGFIVEDR